jgi:hypothetical protein
MIETMEATLAAPAKTAASSNSRVAEGLALIASAGAIFYVWTLNYNKLGSFYDYSIMIDGAGKLEAGLRPFRDYSTPLQSLSIWLAYACESLFGHRYLSLAYGNLILCLGLFFLLLHFARKAFPFPIALLVSFAICTASSLQHGILWYNSIALLLLSAITLKCADLLRAGNIRSRDAILVAVPLFLIAMTKMNFYTVAIGAMVLFALVALASLPHFQGGKKIAALTGLGVLVCVVTPFVEIIANHTTLSNWVTNVILKPSGASAGELRLIFNPAFYLIDANQYPGSTLQCAVSICLAVYVCLAYSAMTDLRSDPHKAIWVRIVRLAILSFFWFSTLLLILTNIEIQTLSLCFCLVGIMAMRISGRFRGPKLEEMLQSSAVILALYFLVVGAVSIVRHSRVSYAWHTFPGKVIPKDGEPAYLRGVELSPQAALQLSRINDLLEKNKGVPVYWGTGVELMNRIHPGVRDSALPLWYHAKASVLDSDTPMIAAAIDRTGADLFVADGLFYYYYLYPPSLRDYMARKWTLEEQDYSLVVYRKKTTQQDALSSTGR